MTATARDERLPQFAALEDFENYRRHILRVPGVEVSHRVAADLRNRRDARRGHREAGGHRFHGRKPEPFVQRRVGKQVRVAVVSAQQVVADLAGERDPVTKALRERQRVTVRVMSPSIFPITMR